MDDLEPPVAGGAAGAPIRLQKALADAGVGSRRACEELIEQGRVAVDGVVVRVQGSRVDAASQVITVDGERVAAAKAGNVYLALNKPRGMLSTMADDRGRSSLGDLVADRSQRVFHVGRLDAESEGLLLLTNDGTLAHRLAHPKYGVHKTYLAEVQGPLGKAISKRLREGVELDDGIARADSVRPVGSFAGRVHLEIVLHEGRNHIVRRMLDAVGHPVLRLVRTAIGPVQLGSLKPGKTRHLTSHEVNSLHQLVEM